MSAEAKTPETEEFTENDPSVAEAAAPKEGSLFLVALRDLAIVTGLLAIWGGTDAWFATTGLGIASWVSTIVGVLAGAASVALIHEWGHFAGARLSGGTAPLGPTKGFLPLFNFDFEKSNTGHFQAMSVGGNLPTWGFALLLAWALPLDTAGRVAIVAGAVGFSIFTLVVEWPVMREVREGGDPMKALRLITGPKIQRAGWIGAGGALLFSLFV